MKNELKVLRESAYDWDLRPHEYFNFSGRVVNKYGLPYIRSKLHFKYNYVVDKDVKEANVFGKFVDEVKEEIQNQNSVNAQQRQNEEGKLFVVDMEVPASQYETWLNSVPSKYFGEYKEKKHILDQYLSKFNSYERNKVIKIMCENANTKNYVQFLDADPDAMTTQQFLIYRDIIRFYEEIYLKDAIEENKIWEQYNTRESSLNKLNEPNASVVSLNDENADNNMDLLRDILSNEETTSEENIQALKQQLDDMITSTEKMAANVDQPVIHEAPVQVQEERLNKVRTLDIKATKTLLFTPQTTMINASQPFGASNAYVPNYKQALSQRGLNLQHTEIARVGYVNNINDLINERNAKAAANQALVNEIIQNQIAYNSQFGNTIQSGLKPSTTQYAPINNSAQAFNASAANNAMSNNFGTSQEVIAKPRLMKAATPRMGAANQPAETTGINKPLLIKKSNTNVVRPAQAYQSVAAKPSLVASYKAPNAINPDPSKAQAEPTTTIQSTLNRPEMGTLQSPIKINTIQQTTPLNTPSTNERAQGQDIVGVYKINTKEIASEQEEKKVLVGIPTKKL